MGVMVLLKGKVRVSKPKQTTRIGDFLRQRRVALNLTQEEMADRLTRTGHTCSPQAISHWENGHSVPPIREPDVAKVFAKAYNIMPSQLLDQIGYWDNLTPDQINVLAKKLPPSLLMLLEQATPDQIELIVRIIRAIISQ